MNHALAQINPPSQAKVVLKSKNIYQKDLDFIFFTIFSLRASNSSW